MVVEISEMKNSLRQVLNHKRYTHSLGVADTAAQLAKNFGTAVEQAYVAGLLHDCAREIAVENMITAAKEVGIIVSRWDQAVPILLHAPLGAVIASEKYGIEDVAILQAIRLHTVGGVRMSVLDKIIYLADMIEPQRDFPGVEELRRLGSLDLDQALLAAFDQSLYYVIKKRQMVHPDTVAARNEILLKDFLVDGK